MSIPRKPRTFDGDDRYRILVVVRHPVGGIRTFMRYVYRRFDARRYAFTLIAPALPELHVLLAEDLSESMVEYAAASPTTTARQFVTLIARVMAAQRFDLVHAHGFSSAVCSVVGALATRTPVIVTTHDIVGDAQFRGIAGGARRACLDVALALAGRVHCVSDDARDNLLSHLPLLSRAGRKVMTIRNGIEVDRFRHASPRNLRAELGLPAGTFLIGFLGRFMSQKGFAYLIDALELLRERRDSAQRPVVLAFSQEDGFIREERDSVRARHLDGCVRFLPFVANAAPTLAGLDVVVMPSLWEACPLLAMEAMVAGVPLVATDCIGLREVVRDTPTAVVPPRDAPALARALHEEMTAPSTALARAFAPEAAIRFDVTDRAREIEVLMQSLVARRGLTIGTRASRPGHAR